MSGLHGINPFMFGGSKAFRLSVNPCSVKQEFQGWLMLSLAIYSEHHSELSIVVCPNGLVGALRPLVDYDALGLLWWLPSARYHQGGTTMRRKTVVAGFVAALLLVIGATQLQAQSTLSLESLSRRIDAISSRLNSLSRTSARKSEVATLQRKVATLEAQIGSTDPAPTAIRFNPTSTPTRPRPTATHRPTATPRPANPHITTTRNMNVRTGPGTNYDIIGVAESGEKFEITGKNASGDWWRIEYDGENAWIYAPFVTATNADRIRPVPTPVPPTATPLPPTATPVPASSIRQDMSAEDAIQSLMLSDYQYNESAFNNLPLADKERVATGYILLFEYAVDYCDLSYGDMAQLIHFFASDLDAIRFTGEDGTKPRGWLMAFIYGFTRDSALGAHSCRTVLDWGRTTALSN